LDVCLCGPAAVYQRIGVDEREILSLPGRENSFAESDSRSWHGIIVH
jgi:hypothetical protein